MPFRPIRKLARWLVERRINKVAKRRQSEMLNFLPGYKTYAAAFVMVLVAVLSLFGVTIPGFENIDAGHLLTEGLAIVFLRKGLKTDAGS